MCEVVDHGDYPAIRVEIPETALRPVGESEDEDKTTGQLLGTLIVQIGRHSVLMHLDIVAVDNDADNQDAAEDAAYSDEDLGLVHAGVNADGHWDTIPIGDRDYVIIATPYC